jgi:flagellar hook-associated protein 3 FlgL
MDALGLGDLASSGLRARQTAALKRQLARHAEEVTTGTVADPMRHRGGNMWPLAEIEGTLSRIGAWTRNGDIQRSRLAAIETALDTVTTLAERSGASMIGAGELGSDAQVTVVATETRGVFDTVIGTLNLRLGDRTLLAGWASDGPALADADTILGALQDAIAAAGAVGLGDVVDAVDAWFADPAGFGTVGYLGGLPSAGGVPVAEGEVMAMPLTAADPALVETLRALALGALVDAGVAAGNPILRAGLVAEGGRALIEGARGRVAVAAEVGASRMRLDFIMQRNAAEGDALGAARAAMLEADPLVAASALTETETQLQALYAITARLSRLSLANAL